MAEKLMRIQIISLCLLVILSACSSDQTASPEQRLRAVLEQIEEAVEDRSVSRAMQHVSEDYADHQGLTKEDLARILQVHYIRNQSISLFTSVHSLELDAEIASLEMSVAMAGHGGEPTLLPNGLRADAVSISAVFQDGSAGWQLISMAWQ